MWLAKVLAGFFFFIALQTPYLEGREVIAILPVEVHYPSSGHEWFGLFLQDELIRQFRLQNNISAISPELLGRWFTEDSSYKNTLPIFLKTVTPHWLLKFEVQKVLKQVSISGWLRQIEAESEKITFQTILPFNDPDHLMKEIMKMLSNWLKDHSLVHHPQGFGWEGIELFYEWKYSKIFTDSASEWKKQLENLDALQSAWPSLSERIHHEKARMLLIQASINLPAFIPTLNLAENELEKALTLRPESDEHHTLLSLVHYLRREKMQTKSEAVIANAANPRNGRALILYGLSIGRKAKDGAEFIRKGLKFYPISKDNLNPIQDPFEALIGELEPWLMETEKKESTEYLKLIRQGEDLYSLREWQNAKKIFMKAFALYPQRPEAQLFLARIQISENDLNGALKKLVSLNKNFPKNSRIILYLGFIHEKLKNYSKAENIYRKTLEIEPKNHQGMLRLSTLLIKTGKYDEARSFLESLTRKYPDYAVGWWNLGLLYESIDELELALQALEKAALKDPLNSKIQTYIELLREELFEDENG